MTIEEQTNASSTAETVQEQATATEVSTEAQPNVAGNKRAFDEIQARAVVTIHDLADEVCFAHTHCNLLTLL